MSTSHESFGKRYSHLIEGLAWLIFVLLAAAYTFEFDDPLPVYDWGPAHWPRVVLFCMFVASCWLIVFESKSQRKANGESSEPLKIEVDMSMRVRIVLIFAMPVLFAFLIHKLGFLLVTPFFLFGYMWLMGVNRLRTLLIMTVSIYSAIVIVFVKLIFTYLPPGAGIFNTLNGKILGLLQ